MMLFVRRSLAAIASAAVMTSLMAGGYPLVAQEGAAKSQAPKANPAGKVESPAPGDVAGKPQGTGRVAPPDATHRVPPGYSKLGLSDQQKDALHKIQAKYLPQIQALEKQADALRAKRETEFEAVLKPAQKRMLAEAEQQKKAAAAAKKAAAAKAAEKEKEKS